MCCLGSNYTKKVLVAYLKFDLTRHPIFYLIVKDLHLRNTVIDSRKTQHEDPSNFYDSFYLCISHLLSSSYINVLLL